jgi:ribosomal protein L7/L12
MTIVRITGYRPNFLTISFVKLLRGATGEGLASAKDKVDGLLDSHSEIEVQFQSVEDSAQFLHAAEEIGAVGVTSPP